jgi:hypothetical protein
MKSGRKDRQAADEDGGLLVGNATICFIYLLTGEGFLSFEVTYSLCFE